MIIPYEVYAEVDKIAEKEIDELENYNRERMLLDINSQVEKLANSVLKEKHDSAPYYEQYEQLQELMAMCVVMNHVLEKGERGHDCMKITEY